MYWDSNVITNKLVQESLLNRFVGPEERDEGWEKWVKGAKVRTSSHKTNKSWDVMISMVTS